LRDGKEETLDVTLGRLELGEQLIANNGANPVPAPEAVPPVGTPEESAAEVEAVTPGLPDIVGFDVAPLDDAKRSEFGIAPEQGGIVVTDVKGGTDAYQKGFIPGLIVTEVNQKPIGTVDELTALVGEAKEAGRPAVLFKVTDPTGTSRFIAVRLG
jgi:serine protease Do